MKDFFDKLKGLNETILVCLAILIGTNVYLFVQNNDIGSSNTALISDTTSLLPESFVKDGIIDPLKYAFVMPVQPGTRWVYAGKRIIYDSEQDKAIETIGQKIVEIKSIKREGKNLRVFISVSYENNPDDFDKFIESFLLSESGYAFDGANLSYLPLVKGQRLSPSEPNFGRDDNYYVDYVSSVSVKDVLGEKHRCYDILNYGLPDDTLDVFCDGVGYIRKSYTHHGTPDEWDYNLIRIESPDLKK